MFEFLCEIDERPEARRIIDGCATLFFIASLIFW
jgi:hypothetical protein